MNFIFKDIRGSFLKRAEGDVVFTNNDGPLIQDLVKRVLEAMSAKRRRYSDGERAGEARRRAGGDVELSFR